MVTAASVEIPRRQFLAAGGLTFAAACIAPKRLFVQADDLPEHAFRVATTAKITVQTLRRNRLAWWTDGRRQEIISCLHHRQGSQ